MDRGLEIAMNTEYEQFRSRTMNTLSDENYREAFKEMAKLGLGPFYGIKLLREVLGLSLAEAKRLVHLAGAWASQREDIARMHDDLEKAAGFAK